MKNFRDHRVFCVHLGRYRANAGFKLVHYVLCEERGLPGAPGGLQLAQPV